jgi:4-amino-4-deoxychorismate lyase
MPSHFPDASAPAPPPSDPPTPRRTVLAVLDEQGTATVADIAQPLVRPDDLGVLRGEGVFETLRAYGGQAFRLSAHLDRMANSADRIAMTLPPRESLEELAACALDAFGPADGSLRLVVTKGPEGQPTAGRAYALAAGMSAASVAAREHGVRAITLAFGVPTTLRSNASWLLGGVKSTSYAPAMAALRTAGAQGVEDVVYISGEGEVLEAPTANVVAVLDGKTVTPPEAEVGILPGTTVGFFGEAIGRRRLSIGELRRAQEVLLLSSVRGVVPVLELDGRPVGDGTVGPRGRELRQAYEDAIRALENASTD